MTSSGLVSPDEIRAAFSAAMSAMYRSEVPQYGTLLEIVAAVNARDADAFTDDAGDRTRLGDERHGAIRLGTAAELSDMRRIFAVMGMSPVDYYDLSVAGVPVHSTAFRPITADAMRRNPFRVFTSLLRLDLIEDADLRARASAILERRRIFTDRALALTVEAERAGGLGAPDAAAFVAEVLETFRWHSTATVDAETYRRFGEAHRLIADVVCFKGPHINHLTPRTTDIDAAQAEMPRRGIAAKAVIEGPPARAVPILLRQTSFKALDEPILFPGADAAVAGTHTARFGEIEQRGLALTPKGRALYDRLLDEARAAEGDAYAAALTQAFRAFPDDLETLRREGLGYFRYVAAQGGAGDGPIDALVARGAVIAQPILYEDFLPVSAAGIFQSNLGAESGGRFAANAAKERFEEALGAPVLDGFALYAAEEARSIQALGSGIAA